MNQIPDDKAFTQPCPPFSPAAGWNSTDTPEEGADVEVYSSDARGPYLIPFPVIFRNDRWWNARTGEELDTYIEGWRLRAAH